MDSSTLVGSLALVISAMSLLLSIAIAVVARRSVRRVERAAVVGDLYPVLRSLRDAAWEYGKVLGGQSPQALMALNAAVRDLIDLHPAIEDEELAAILQDVLQSDAVSLALTIDPARFVGAAMADEVLRDFVRVSQRGQDAIHRTQALRRGVPS